MSLSNGRWFVNLLYFVVVIMNINNLKIQRLMEQKRHTSHILHLLLCIPTIGFWIFIWLFMALYNTLHNSSIERKIDNLMDKIIIQDNLKRKDKLLG